MPRKKNVTVQRPSFWTRFSDKFADELGRSLANEIVKSGKSLSWSTGKWIFNEVWKHYFPYSEPEIEGIRIPDEVQKSIWQRVYEQYPYLKFFGKSKSSRLPAEFGSDYIRDVDLEPLESDPNFPWREPERYDNIFDGLDELPIELVD